MSNAPMMQAESASFFATWVNALTKPRAETYAAMAASPKAKATTGYLWVFLTSIVASVMALIVQGATIRTRLAESGLGGQEFQGGFGAVALSLLCVTPIVAILGTAFFAIIVALVQWIARMFGGRGTNDQLAYTWAAIGAPYSLLSGVLVLLSALPYVGLCFTIISAVGLIYIAVLNIMAVKGVNQFGWGPAIGSVFIPWLAFIVVCICVIGSFILITGAAIGDIFRTINQSLVP